MDNLEELEEFDGYSTLRNSLARLSAERGEWAGYPMPLPDHDLVVDPSYLYAAQLKAAWEAQKPADEEAEVDHGEVVRGTWETAKGTVIIYEGDRFAATGKVDWLRTQKVPTSLRKTGLLLKTLGASEVWGIRQESQAMATLSEMVRHHKMKKYLLTGSFLETSPRSQIAYLFRRLRPTIALSCRKGYAEPLCTLCMHPIGYYDGSWAGAMCPTDDVIAHLSLMRGDEHMLWKRCNQHPVDEATAGL